MNTLLIRRKEFKEDEIKGTLIPTLIFLYVRVHMKIILSKSGILTLINSQVYQLSIHFLKKVG